MVDMTTGEEEKSMSKSVYARRRMRLSWVMKEGVAIIFNAPIRRRNGYDGDYPYRPDSNFWYLTGLDGNQSESSVLVIVAGQERREILFTVGEIDPSLKCFLGDVIGPERAKKEYAFDEVYSLSELDAMMPKILAEQNVLHYCLGKENAWDKKVFGWIRSAREINRRKWPASVSEIRDIYDVIAEMRLVKDKHEIDLLRESAKISAEAASLAMMRCVPGMNEYQLEARIVSHFVSRGGSKTPAFPCIVASGKNACTLHYVANNSVMKDGDLVLVDIGAEKNYYAGDISRTFPVNGKFTEPQNALYEICLSAERAAIEQMVPSKRYSDAHHASVGMITSGLVRLGLLKGSVPKNIEKGKYRRFYMHSCSHWQGLDVHDGTCYQNEDGTPRLLAPGMVLTAEPGIYIPDEEDIPPEYRGIGIRIEDDILITETGNEVLTSHAPKTVEEIENLMA